MPVLADRVQRRAERALATKLIPAIDSWSPGLSRTIPQNSGDGYVEG
jgi:hypothetical protein